jgi:hypothetical protein
MALQQGWEIQGLIQGLYYMSEGRGCRWWMMSRPRMKGWRPQW